MTYTRRKATTTIVAIGLALAVAFGISVIEPHKPIDAQAEISPAKIERLESLSDVFAQISEAASPAVVFIKVEKEVTTPRMPGGMGGMSPEDFFEHFFGPRFRGPGERNRESEAPSEPQRHIVGQGSGFVVEPNGHIITNNHVVADVSPETDRIIVTLDDGREFDAEVIGADPDTEVALIKIDAENLATIKLANSDKIRVGEWVLAIGNPFGLSHSVTAGIVSAKGRGNVGITAYSDYIQTDAAINPGNSGGPLLNLDGEAVGLNTAIFSRSGGYMGIGFAVPANVVAYVRDQLMESGTVQRGFLGVMIQPLTSDMADFFKHDEHGILVADVSENSPAEKGGLKPGDVIVELNGEPVGELQSFRARISTTKPGSKVDLTVVRDGERLRRKVKLGTLDENKVASAGRQRGQGSRSELAFDQLGLAVENLTDDLADQFDLKDTEGVVITDVRRGSEAARKRIEPGMVILEVNRRPVTNVDALQKALEEAGNRPTVLLTVRDGNYSRFVPLRLSQ